MRSTPESIARAAEDGFNKPVAALAYLVGWFVSSVLLQGKGAAGSLH